MFETLKSLAFQHLKFVIPNLLKAGLDVMTVRFRTKLVMHLFLICGYLFSFHLGIHRCTQM